jgi:hypothetical protein
MRDPQEYTAEQAAQEAFEDEHEPGRPPAPGMEFTEVPEQLSHWSHWVIDVYVTRAGKYVAHRRDGAHGDVWLGEGDSPLDAIAATFGSRPR